jgi:hypothetical protein
VQGLPAIYIVPSRNIYSADYGYSATAMNIMPFYTFYEHNTVPEENLKKCSGHQFGSKVCAFVGERERVWSKIFSKVKTYMLV